MCFLHLTHPSAHTPGAVGSRHCGMGDVLMMCVSAGKSEGEIAWSASVRGQKAKRGVLAIYVFGLSSCMWGAENWLLIDLVLFLKNVTKSSAVKEGWGWWRGIEERVECFEEIACVRCAVDLVVEV